MVNRDPQGQQVQWEDQETEEPLVLKEREDQQGRQEIKGDKDQLE